MTRSQRGKESIQVQRVQAGREADFSRREWELEQVEEMKRSRAWLVLTKAGGMVGEVPETRCETRV